MWIIGGVAVVKRVLRDLETFKRGEVFPPVETIISISSSPTVCEYARGVDAGTTRSVSDGWAMESMACLVGLRLFVALPPFDLCDASDLFMQ